MRTTQEQVLCHRCIINHFNKTFLCPFCSIPSPREKRERTRYNLLERNKMTSRITDSTSLGLGLFCASVLLYSLNERTYRTIKADETDDASNHQPKETSVNDNVNDNGNNDCDIPSQITLEGTDDESKEISLTRRVQAPNTITIAYASTTGTCKGFAETLETKLQNR